MYNKLQDVPREKRVNLIEIFWCKFDSETKSKSRWVRVACNWQCLYATKKRCDCLCHGRNHQSKGLKEFATNVAVNWPDMVDKFISSIDRSQWTGNFKVKINWSLIKEECNGDLRRLFSLDTREGRSYKESIDKLLKIVSLEESDFYNFSENVVSSMLIGSVKKEEPVNILI